jgi:hypothetical protein
MRAGGRDDGVHSLYPTVLAFWLLSGVQPIPASVIRHELRLTVVDVSGGVIVGATVMMDGADKDDRTGVADARGQFAVGALGPGKCRVLVAAPGFAVFSTTVDIRQSVTTPDVTLQVAIAESVEVAMVSARLRQAPAWRRLPCRARHWRRSRGIPTRCCATSTSWRERLASPASS